MARQPARAHSLQPTLAADPMSFGPKEREYVYAIAMKYLKDEEDASDAAQDALLLAYRHRGSFRGDARFSTWLYRVAATTSLMALRKRRRKPPTISSDSEEQPLADQPSATPTPEELSAANETLAQAESNLGEMGDKYGRVFRMRFLEGYNEREIAEELGLNEATVKTRAYRARNHMRRTLAAAS